MWSKVVPVLANLIGLALIYYAATKPHQEQALGQHAQQHKLRTIAPLYKNTIMPVGDCKIVASDGLPAAFNDTEFPSVIPLAINPHYGGHIVMRGRDGKIYHKYQRTANASLQTDGLPHTKGNWTDWKCLTPDLTKIPCSSAPKCNGYDNNPVIAVQPEDGTLVVFARQMDDLDIHEMHLTEAQDPESWCAMRAPACLCNFPPCTNQTKCGTQANCDNKGVDCSDKDHQPNSTKYWSTQPSFPTSELNLIADTEGKLNLYFRGFDGNFYVTRQGIAGNAVAKYEPPVMFGTNAIVE